MANCVVVKLITVDKFVFLFNCTTVDHDDTLLNLFQMVGYPCLWPGPLWSSLWFSCVLAMEAFAFFHHDVCDCVCFPPDVSQMIWKTPMQTKYTFVIWSCVRIKGWAFSWVKREVVVVVVVVVLSTDRSKTAPLLQFFFFVYASVVSYVALVLSLFVPYLSFFRCLMKASWLWHSGTYIFHVYFVFLQTKPLLKEVFTKRENWLLNGERILFFSGRPRSFHKETKTVLTNLWSAQDFGFRGDKYIIKKIRVISFARDIPTDPPLYPYQIWKQSTV